MAKQNRRKELLHFFKTICRIPRQSGDEEAISRYMVEFAKSRGLAAERDAFCNVLIRKPATIPGYSGPTVILQGHMDMVYVKTPESAHIYKDGIRVKEEDGFLRAADGTSLGADNGLALACVMDLMDRRDLRLPALEILLTASEETGLEGVKNLGFHDVKGTYLINLDAEEEGVFITSCAGGVRTDLSLPLAYETKAEETGVLLTLEGLRGGHSGLDIGLGRANAVRILGRILSHANGLADCSYLESLGKANAIASQGSVRLHMSQERREALLKKLCSLERDVRQEFAGTEEIRFRIAGSAGIDAGIHGETDSGHHPSALRRAHMGSQKPGAGADIVQYREYGDRRGQDDFSVLGQELCKKGKGALEGVYAGIGAVPWNAVPVSRRLPSVGIRRPVQAEGDMRGGLCCIFRKGCCFYGNPCRD